MDFRITRNLTSDGFSRWIAGFSDYRFLLSKKLQPRSIPVTAHLQNKVHPMILPIIYAMIGWCLFSFDKQLHQNLVALKTNCTNSEIHWLFCLVDKKIRARPCLSQQVPPTGCDCIVHGPHGLGIHLDSCFMGIRSASCGLAGESPTMHQQNLMNHSSTSRITLFLESYSFHLSLISKNNTNRRMYNESRQN